MLHSPNQEPSSAVIVSGSPEFSSSWEKEFHLINKTNVTNVEKNLWRPYEKKQMWPIWKRTFGNLWDHVSGEWNTMTTSSLAQRSCKAWKNLNKQKSTFHSGLQVSYGEEEAENKPGRLFCPASCWSSPQFSCSNNHWLAPNACLSVLSKISTKLWHLILKSYF